MKDTVAIDCCWLVHLDADDVDFFPRLRLLAALDREQVQLLFDHANHIHGEYAANVTGSLGRKFIKNFILAGRVSYAAGDLTAREAAALDKVSFDPSDRPYLAVAARTGALGFITDEEKHLTTEQRSNVLVICGVRVLNTDGALALLT